MELKDVILSTLAEIGEEPETPAEKKEIQKLADLEASMAERLHDPRESAREATEETAHFVEEERLFLEHLRERILVLFEGFQSPNNKRLEAKIDLTLNFLEYLLATLDERIEALKKT